MRPAQLGVKPGTLASSSALAWLMSTRASGGGAVFFCADACGAAVCAWLNAPLAAVAMQAASTAIAANWFRAGTHSFSACLTARGKKSRSRRQEMQLTPLGLSPYLEKRCRASAITD